MILLKILLRKKFLLWIFLTPIDFNIAISLVLFLTNIVSPEIILKAAIKIINDKIMNITFLSTFNAEKSDLFKSAHELIRFSLKTFWNIFFLNSICFGSFKKTSKYLLFSSKSKNSSRSFKFKNAMFWLNSFISLSKMDSTINDFCLGRLPAIDVILLGEITLILSPMSASKIKLSSFPIEIWL